MNNERTWYIYILKDPRYDTVRYVGWSFDVAQRVSSHISTAPKTKSHKAHWIQQLLGVDLRPIIEIVEFGNGDWREAEQRWIAHYRNIGADLTNMTNGGEGTPGCYPDEDTRRKMSVAQTGRKQTPESTAKTKAALTGRKKSPEHVKKMSDMRKGIVPIIATNAAAIANRGRKQSPEHVAKRIAVHIGVPRLDLRKLQPDQVREIRAAQGKESQRALAKRFGVGIATINNIQHRRQYRDVLD